MPEYSQETRIIAVQTPLGDDVLLLQKLTGVEGVSRLFTFHLDLLSEDASIAFNDIVGQRVTITIHLANDENRYINGFVSRFTQSGRDIRFAHYQAEVVPWLWFLTRNANCRIFQDKSPVEIIKQVFTDLGFSGDFKDKTTGSYPTREYCVQYRETDFNFVSRLMEEYGIFYYFEHEVTKHKLVLADATSAHQPCPNQATAIFDNTARLLGEERITAFEIGQELKTGECSTSDYNFETPLMDLNVSEPTVFTVANNGTFELYDYPGIYTKKPEGEQVVKVRMQEQEASHMTGNGESTCGAFTPGYRFDLQEHYRRDLNQSYVLTEVEHEANCGSSYYTNQAEVEETYTNEFSVIPYSVPYRPDRTARRPFVQGPQTAVVVGPGGEEIYVDKYGRVKVQFFWDREGKANENSSCWVRVSQLWAGKNWGAMWIPRIGHEVIVDFLEGDPDRPLITGRVYNADHMPPYTLPDEKTKSTIKSYSSKGGGGYNEIRFEDKKGSEQIFIHAERNQDIRIKSNLMENVGYNTNLTVGYHQKEKIKGDKHLKVEGDHNQEICGSESLKVGQNLQEKVGQNFAVDAGTEIYLKAGMNLVIESGTTLTLKVGGNFINLNAGGIFIKGTMVMLNSGGAAGSGSGCSPDPPKDPDEADTAEPGYASGPPPSYGAKKTVTPPSSYSPAALVLKSAAQSGAPFCDI